MSDLDDDERLDDPPFSFRYLNHRGITTVRNVRDMQKPWYGVTPYYPEPGWNLEAFDIDTSDTRTFRMDRMSKL